MRPRFLAITALLVSAAVAPADPDELRKIDRTIRKEPAYKTKSPTYCLLVLGPEAKTRIWLIRDGGTLYVDRNGNGDLTEAEDKVAKDKPGPKEGERFRLGTLVESDGKTEHRQVGVKFEGDNCFLSAQVIGWGNQDNRPHEGWLQFAAKPTDAPVVHFRGPLTLRLTRPLALSGKDRAGEVRAELGTRGLGKGTFMTLPHFGVPAGAHPVADLEFPHKKVGEPPLKVRVVMNHRC